MKIKEGAIVHIVHTRKGGFNAMAERDFDTEVDEFYPVILAQKEEVQGITNVWIEGDPISCRKDFVQSVTIIQE